MLSITQKILIDIFTNNIFEHYKDISGQKVSLPIPIFEIAEKLFFLRIDMEFLRGSLKTTSGVLIPNKRWIILNKGHPLERQVFTLAHELAHWIIEYQEKTLGDLSLATMHNLSNMCDKEMIAGYFASAILMPQEMLMNEIYGLSAISDKEVIDLASKFGVSYSAMAIRIKDLVQYRGEFQNQLRIDDNNFITVRKHKPFRREPIKYKYTLVRIKSPIIDHNLIRKLSALKKNSDFLYVIWIDDDKEDSISLLNFNCVDGLAAVRPALEDEIFNSESNENDTDVRFVDIESGNWVHNLIYTFDMAKEGPSQIFFRGIDAKLYHKQKELFDIKRYIVPQTTFNYRKEAQKYIQIKKADGKRTVIATGCFDLVHTGHINFLKRAKAAGDVLIVGLEDDARVHALKGKLRPVNTISQRIELIDALEFVDFTFVIRGSPKNEIKEFYTRLHKILKADVLAVSEGDPHIQDRKDEIEAAGGELVVISRLNANSTTSLIRRFLANTDYSDMIIVSKKKLLEYTSSERIDWRQFKLPLDF